MRDGERPLSLGGRKQRTLLAILLLHANEVVASDTLIDGLWGERAPKTAGTALQVYVSNLRKLLSPERLETRSPGYLLHVEPEELDLARFERMAAEANGDDSQVAAAHRGERAPELKLLVTSREPLHLAAESEYPVAPLRERDAVVLLD